VHKARAVAEELPGWNESITEARSIDDLPREARDYLDFVGERLGVPIVLIGVGPGREQVIRTGEAPHLLAEEHPEPAVRRGG
jgi:adenylosuccinate synthase